jgi:hypothetical protein
MLIEKKCKICGATFVVPHWRADTAKYCSVICQNKSLRGKQNVVCTNCGKSFHMKPYQQKRTGRNMGYFCSKKCFYEYKKVWFVGENNHQYGLKGDLNASFKGNMLDAKNNHLMEVEVYASHRVDANKCGRVVLHRLLVEKNWKHFGADFFDVIAGQHVLKKGLQVHHIDGNHSNNSLDNLMIVTKAEHRKLHNAAYYMLRSNRTGRFVARVLLPMEVEWEEADELTATDRGTGGYGSTGK